MEEYKENVNEKKININNNENKELIDNPIKKINIELNIKKSSLLVYISLVKIVSAFLVILKHTNRFYWDFNDCWSSNNILSSFCMCAVPLFSLCIGATLLNFNERYDIKEYWKRRFQKVILPIIGWNIFYYFFRIYIVKNFKKEKITLSNIIKLYFNNELYPIIGSLRTFLLGYLLIPLIAYVNKKNKIQIYSYCLVILLINQSIIPYLLKFDRSNQIIWPYNFNVGYIIYIFAGYIIQNHSFNKGFKYCLYISGVIGLIMRLYIAHYLTMKYKQVDGTQVNYLNFPIICYSCSVFLFIKENCIYLYKIINIHYINKIGSLSIGPFFLHYAIIWGLPCLYDFNQYTFNFRFFGAFFISIICFFLTALIKKIPIIKYLTP